jgi:hypothetical protein
MDSSGVSSSRAPRRRPARAASMILPGVARQVAHHRLSWAHKFESHENTHRGRKMPFQPERACARRRTGWPGAGMTAPHRGDIAAGRMPVAPGTPCWPPAGRPRPSCATNTWPRCTQRQRHAAHRLDAALHALWDDATSWRRLPALPQGPFLRRIRVRLGLGQRLRQHGLRTTPRRWWPCPSRRCRARGCWRATPPAGRRWQAPCATGARRTAVVAAPAVCQRCRPGGLRSRRPDAAPQRAVPLDRTGIRRPAIRDFDASWPR